MVSTPEFGRRTMVGGDPKADLRDLMTGVKMYAQLEEDVRPAERALGTSSREEASFKKQKGSIGSDEARNQCAGLNSFSRVQCSSSLALGNRNLKVQVGFQELDIEFVVVDIPFPYNAIVGKDWLHWMKGVASTLNQVFKFAGPRGEKILYGDQVAAKQCYHAIVSTKATMKEVQLVEEEREVLEDVGRAPEAKVVEDLLRYKLDERSLDCYFLIGSNLKEWERIELIEFLKANIEIFGWTPYEMPRISFVM
ncbi:hypothetical protein Acr_08g0010080 [Actinidia rufa]|uniref:Uncharacterized protein n=1 Tax=Actinidia rufa TaxID=165716 RepID=A0A7J0F1Q3_9ERIC|nr:hypothetical protein Acr_08g0010080 [Actinidia rufa]